MYIKIVEIGHGFISNLVSLGIKYNSPKIVNTRYLKQIIFSHDKTIAIETIRRLRNCRSHFRQQVNTIYVRNIGNRSKLEFKQFQLTSSFLES